MLHYKHHIRYTRDFDKPEKQWIDGGHVEHDGKSCAVFKDKDGKVLSRRVCSALADNEVVCVAGKLIIEVQGPVEENSENAGTQRKTLISKSATCILSSAASKGDSVKSAKKEAHTIKFIYTQDKHKKQQKKWLDGTLTIDENGFGTFTDDDSLAVVYKRHFIDSSHLIDGHEFDGPRYRFQITEPKLPDKSEKTHAPVRKRTISMNKQPIKKLKPDSGSDCFTNADALLDVFQDFE